MQYILLILVLIAIVAFASKPSDEYCFTAVKTRLKEKMYGKTDPENPFLPGIAEMAINRGVKIEDKIFFKEIGFSFGKHTRNIGYGVFGKVFVTATNKYKPVSE